MFVLHIDVNKFEVSIEWARYSHTVMSSSEKHDNRGQKALIQHF